MDLTSVAKYFIYTGVVLLLIGSLLYFLSKIGIGIGIGKLPGDILIKKDNFAFYFPIVTCIIVSIVLTIIASLFFRK